MQRFIHSLYSVLFYLALPLILIRLLLRSRKAPLYRRRWAERFGFCALSSDFNKNRQTVWIHAVSVGETNAAAPLIRQLQQHYPALQIMITTMTATGSERVRALFGDSVFHSYAPYDLPAAMNRFLDRLNPALLVIMETELWPNMIHCSSRKGVKLLLANARLSEKSAQGYRRFSALTADMLDQIDHFAVQAEADSQRFISLGVAGEKLSITGSLKFNVEISASHSADGLSSNAFFNVFFKAIKESGRTVIIAASTREGEEIKVLKAFRQCVDSEPGALLLLVPRHPARFDKVARLCQNQGFEIVRRSQQQTLLQSTQIVIGDSMGEMMDYYAAADLAFVGGSLVDTGCQNVLEPAALGLPVLVGPSQFNFASICAQLEAAGALRTVADENELADSLIQLLQDKNMRQQMGAEGKTLIQANQQALPALLKIIERLMPD